MTSPAKKRKTNDYKASPKTVRSLDFFFGKQKDGKNSSTKDETKQEDSEDLYGDGEEEVLTDEQLARKLQAQWNKEDHTANGTTAPPAPPAPSPPLSSKSPGNRTAEPEDDADSGTTDTQRQAVAEETALEETKKDVPRPAFGKNTLSLQSASAKEDTVSSTIPFDESPLTFDPAKYISDLKDQWAGEGGNATYALLTRCFVLVNSTQSRIKIVDTLVNLLRTIIEADPQSLLPTVWLATNSISPPYIDLELGLGGSSISKALKKVCGLDNAGLKTLYNKYGDAGDVAFEAKKRQSLTLRKPKPLTIKGVFEALVKIAKSQGHGSQEAKQRIVERLVQDSRGAEESRYIVRTLVQHLRIGAVKTTMLIALSRAFQLSRPRGTSFPIQSQSDLVKMKKEALTEIYARGEEIVKACFARHPNYNDLVPALLEVGVSEELLLRCGLSLHIPLRPMLGSITRDLAEMLTKLQGRDFSCEYKYDGQRAQVHCDENGKVTIFSRHLEVMTEKYPDLVALVPKIRGDGVSSFIMEGEVVAVDRETGELKPFQILANRARKDVAINEVKVNVCLFSFDLMYLNGEELLNRPFRERRSLLRSLFTEIPNHFTWVKNLDATSADSETVLDFFKSATDVKCEGIMVKVLDNLPNPDLQANAEADGESAEPKPQPTTPSKSKKGTKTKSKSKGIKQNGEDSTEPADKEKSTRRKALLATYEPDKRLDSWLKVKKDYNTAADTLDLIPIAGWHGQGRKAKWWSPILLAVRNPETGCLEAVTKCMSGFTDKFYQANKEKYAEESDNVLPEKPSYVEYGGVPAVWFEPQEVWEMAFADVTLSPTYTAAMGLVSEERGLSLRFPRFLKVREDKSIDEATDADYLAELYRKQETRAPGKGAVAENEEADDVD
ncbi:putative DNA ligase I [Viridothelium virens]|uniref:DNA ligase n=1 Tax=Viridothelium virens TaxID=1048519 RepID=A0A6A6HHQ9_VIRVR|nr:putative DNA ligase I [Viridothelium virens]